MIARGKPAVEEGSTRIQELCRKKSRGNGKYACKYEGLSFFLLLIIYLSDKRLLKDKYIVEVLTHVVVNVYKNNNKKDRVDIILL